jgi:hypothetical protein
MTAQDRKLAINAVDSAAFDAIKTAFQHTLDNPELGSWINSDTLAQEIERITDARMVAVAAIEAQAEVAP